MSNGEPICTCQAWDLIGYEGSFRIAGGRTVYEAVLYNDASAKGDKVRLARLDTRHGLRQINRWVEPDTPIEVLQIFKHLTD